MNRIKLTCEIYIMVKNKAFFLFPYMNKCILLILLFTTVLFQIIARLYYFPFIT